MINARTTIANCTRWTRDQGCPLHGELCGPVYSNRRISADAPAHPGMGNTPAINLDAEPTGAQSIAPASVTWTTRNGATMVASHSGGQHGATIEVTVTMDGQMVGTESLYMPHLDEAMCGKAGVEFGARIACGKVVVRKEHWLALAGQ